MYKHNNHCHRATVYLQLNIIIIIIIIISSSSILEKITIQKKDSDVSVKSSKMLLM
jgi:hypothetical protein